MLQLQLEDAVKALLTLLYMVKHYELSYDLLLLILPDQSIVCMGFGIFSAHVEPRNTGC